MTVKDLINMLGGTLSVAKKLGMTTATTIYGWRNRNKIPYWRLSELKKIAKKQGLSLDIFDELEK